MVKLLSTSSHQTNLQNLSSPLHLSVLQHLSIIFVTSYGVIDIISKNSTALLSINGSEAVSQTCSVKKGVLRNFENSQKSTCARVSFLIKLQAFFLKKRLWHRCFSVNFAKFLRTPFLTEYLRWLLPIVDVTDRENQRTQVE